MVSKEEEAKQTRIESLIDEGMSTAARIIVPATAMILTTGRVAAQSDGGGGGGGGGSGDPIANFVNNTTGDIIFPIMVLGALAAVVGFGVSQLVQNPETKNRMNALRNGGVYALFGTPLLAGFIDYMAPSLPFEAAQQIDLVPYAVVYLAQFA